MNWDPLPLVVNGTAVLADDSNFTYAGHVFDDMLVPPEWLMYWPKAGLRENPPVLKLLMTIYKLKTENQPTVLSPLPIWRTISWIQGHSKCSKMLSVLQDFQARFLVVLL